MTEPEQKQDKDNGFKSGIRGVLERFLLRKVRRASQPYIPQPGQQIHNPAFNFNGDYTETEAEVQRLYGTGLTFGTQKHVSVDDNGNVANLIQSPNYLVGQSGQRVADIADIGGVCRFCQMQAMEAYQRGELTAQQAQLQSLFHISSGKQCDICGIYVCAMHCRPLETDEGVIQVCVACRNEINRRNFRRKVIAFLLAPLTETPDQE